jgi:outer membrane protein assembly factor BamB
MGGGGEGLRLIFIGFLSNLFFMDGRVDRNIYTCIIKGSFRLEAKKGRFKMYNRRITFLLVLSICFLLGMATRKEAENAAKESVNATEVSVENEELKIELVKKIESVSDYLMSNDGTVLLYTPKSTGQTRASGIKMLNISVDAETKVLSFEKTRSVVDIDPEVLDASWTELFKDKIIYKGDESGYAAGAINLVTRRLDGAILSKIRCYYDNCIPVISPTGKYVALIPSYDSDYPSLKAYETETGKKLWEKFTPPDIDKWYGGESHPFYITASFASDDSLVVCYDGEVCLFDTKSGNNYWKREVVNHKNVQFWFEEIYLKCSNEGDIIFSYPGKEEAGYIYSITNKGDIRWRKKREGVLDAVPRFSPFGKYVLFGLGEVGLLNNKNGELIWKFEGDLLGTGRNKNYFTFEDEYLIANAKVPSENSREAKDKVIVIKSNSGDVIIELEGKDLIFSGDEKILAFKRNETLFLYKIFMEEVK